MRPSSFLTLLISIASRRMSKMLTTWSWQTQTWSWQTQTSPTPGNMEQAIFRGSATDYLGNIWGYNLSTLGDSQLKRWQDIEQTTEVVGGPLIQYDLGQARLQRVSPQRLLDTVVVVAWLRLSLRFWFCRPVLRPLHPAGPRHRVAALQVCHWPPGHCVSRVGVIGGRKKVIEQDLGHLTNCQTITFWTANTFWKRGTFKVTFSFRCSWWGKKEHLRPHSWVRQTSVSASRSFRSGRLSSWPAVETVELRLHEFRQ